MTPEQVSALSYTVEHFQDVARQNRFAENASVAHDAVRCVICHPELLPMDPFATYLEVITPSVKVRRPCLDAALVDAINDDLALLGLPAGVSLESLLAEETQAVACWHDWIRDALSTGLDLLAVHSPTSVEFSLEEPESTEQADLIEAKIQEIMDHQKNNTRRSS
jgi:hypothetical protein